MNIWLFTCTSSPISSIDSIKFSKFSNETHEKCARCGKEMMIYSESGDTYNYDSTYSQTFICQDKYCGMWFKEDYTGKCVIF